MLHARFAGPGDPTRPVELTLDPIDDGGSFSRRRVAVTQEAKQVLELSASFHRDEAGPEHQAFTASSSSPDAVPSVDDLEPYDERTRQWWARLNTWLPVEIRSNVIPGRWAAPGAGPAEPRQQMWLRIRAAGRSLCRGQMFDRSGRLVATSMQEGLLRVRDGVQRAHPPRLPAAARTVHPVPSRGARAESERSTCTCR